jgi:hypothetical protein
LNEEPDAGILHVRIRGSPGAAMPRGDPTDDPTRQDEAE